MILAFAISFYCEIFQFDGNSAYLNADLELDVYVKQLPGFEFPGKVSKIVCKSLKGLSSLEQSGHCRNRTLNLFLTEFGLRRSMIESCCYFMNNLRGNRRLICVWVNDITYLSSFNFF